MSKVYIVEKGGEEYFVINGMHYLRTGPNERAIVSEETIAAAGALEEQDLRERDRKRDIEAAFPGLSAHQHETVGLLMRTLGMDASNVRALICDLVRVREGVER